MGLPSPKPRYTLSEYLRLEQDSTDKHEYCNGEIIAMAGGSPDHSRISANVSGELRSRLKGTSCGVFDSNLRVRIARTILYTYPDASVVCGPLKYDEQDPLHHTVTNPRVIIEVLSPSSEGYDRGDKFARYRQIATLEEYVLVSQLTPRVESYLRQPEGTWLLSAAAGLDAVVRVRCLEVSLPLVEVYAGVSFPEVPADVAAQSI